jgi:plastocyanin
VAELGSLAPRELPDTRVAVVFLESAPAAAFEGATPERARIDQRNETFVPRVLSVAAGSVVDFPNSDSTYPNVFSLSRAKRFDLGRYANGASKSVRFDRPGIVRVFCDIHSHMSAFIVVFNHPYFRVTDVDGRFRIDNIPAGTYTVVGWYEGEARVHRGVTVTPGAVTELDLVVP